MHTARLPNVGDSVATTRCQYQSHVQREGWGKPYLPQTIYPTPSPVPIPYLSPMDRVIDRRLW